MSEVPLYTLPPTPYPLPPTPFPAPYTLHPTPYTPLPTPELPSVLAATTAESQHDFSIEFRVQTIGSIVFHVVLSRHWFHVKIVSIGQKTASIGFTSTMSIDFLSCSASRKQCQLVSRRRRIARKLSRVKATT